MPRQYLPYLTGFFFYLVNYFVIVFFNTAQVACALKRISFGDPDLGHGLAEAVARLPQILSWAPLAATFAHLFLFLALETRFGFVANIVTGLIGVVWSLVTHLVVPVLAAERVGPLRAIRRSAELRRKGWGESAVANLSMGVAGLLLGILLIVVAGSIGIAAVNPWLALSVGAPAVLHLLARGIITSTLQGIVLAGVHLFASTGQVPAGLSRDVVQSAFVAKA